MKHSLNPNKPGKNGPCKMDGPGSTSAKATSNAPGTHVKSMSSPTKAKQTTEHPGPDYDRRTGWYGKKDNPKEEPSMDDFMRLI